MYVYNRASPSWEPVIIVDFFQNSDYESYCCFSLPQRTIRNRNVTMFFPNSSFSDYERYVYRKIAKMQHVNQAISLQYLQCYPPWPLTGDEALQTLEALVKADYIKVGENNNCTVIV